MNKGLLVMSLKQFVNNKQAIEEFYAHIDDLVTIQHRIIESADTPVEVHRAQGAISVLRRLKLLRETVNGFSK
jgi:hypothetical protein